MLGKMIDDKLIERRLSRTEFAKRLNRSRSYVYSILERDSVETEDLLKISNVHFPSLNNPEHLTMR